ncbi:murein peptide ligase domain protein [Mycobacterium ulcerans str. Harvey]|uniref:Murein peptide ligase domain protein n=1 Tax=Mycobacterium ulcerans str. Harvey TaxID=1299332 RepID=A0ABN0RAF8_MYCUL|nr:murein peptide ligase domain protein [Mycobacterium ulcerans str. Harvey]
MRLGYAGVQHTLVHDTVAAIESCPPGPVEVSPTTPRSSSCSGG